MIIDRCRYDIMILYYDDRIFRVNPKNLFSNLLAIIMCKKMYIESGGKRPVPLRFPGGGGKRPCTVSHVLGLVRKKFVYIV